MNYAAFPLELVVLPGESVALHLFEARYLQLYEDHKEGNPFAIVYKNEKQSSPFASIVQIEETANSFPDGTIDVIIKGLGIIQIKSFQEKAKDKLYPIVEGVSNTLNQSVTEDLKTTFETYLQLVKKKLPLKDDFSLYYIANRLQLDMEHKMELMSLQDNREINCFLINQIRLMSRCLELEEKLKQRFHLN